MFSVLAQPPECFVSTFHMKENIIVHARWEEIKQTSCFVSLLLFIAFLVFFVQNTTNIRYNITTSVFSIKERCNMMRILFVVIIFVFVIDHCVRLIFRILYRIPAAIRNNILTVVMKGKMSRSWDMWTDPKSEMDDEHLVLRRHTAHIASHDCFKKPFFTLIPHHILNGSSEPNSSRTVDEFCVLVRLSGKGINTHTWRSGDETNKKLNNIKFRVGWQSRKVYPIFTEVEKIECSDDRLVKRPWINNMWCVPICFSRQEKGLVRFWLFQVYLTLKIRHFSYYSFNVFIIVILYRSLGAINSSASFASQILLNK